MSLGVAGLQWGSSLVFLSRSLLSLVRTSVVKVEEEEAIGFVLLDALDWAWACRRLGQGNW